MTKGGSHQGLLLVLSGPSGVGKTTIVRALEQRLSAVFSVSATTRSASSSETHGRDYLFVDEPEFQRMIELGAFLEYARVFGQDWYGTPRAAVEAQLEAGKLVVLDIDVQGALQVRRTMPDACLIFILPPSDEELLRRLRDRRRDDEEAIKRRFTEAKAEMQTAARSGAYDLTIVNDDLDRTIEQVIGSVQHALGAGGASAPAARSREETE